MPSPAQPTFQNYALPPLVVDLALRNGSTRWANVIAAERETARTLFASAWKEFPPAVRNLSGWFGEMYREHQGPYQSELQAWAKAMNEEFGSLAMVNCAYELGHLGETFTVSDIVATMWGKLFGCAAAVVQLADGEMIHVRNLDWPIAGMGPATRVFEFQQGARNFYIVGFPAFVGALSGLVPRGYSVTVNWAPPSQAPSFDHAAVFLLRETLEDCSTYAAAVSRLKKTRLSSSVFFTVCGVAPGEGCVIERTPDRASVRDFVAPGIVQTNHHDDAGAFTANNRKLEQLAPKDFLVRSTRRRQADLQAALAPLAKQRWPEGARKNAFARDVFAFMDEGQVTNFETCQRMIFRPHAGEYYVQTSV